MANVLFMASTPLHSLWALAMAAGAFAARQSALALIDQRPADRDFIAEVLGKRLPAPFVEVRRFEQIGKKPLQKLTHARARMREVMEFARQFAPDYVAVGNDRRAEFHAALHACPQATGAYFDDGLASYSEVPAGAVAQSKPLRVLANGFRSLLYGLPTEREPYIGVSHAAREAWVMLPDHVHGGLRAKPLRRIEPEWFHLPLVQETCAQASLNAGLEQRALDGIQLLLVLPHDSLLRGETRIRERFQQYVDRARATGGTVAIKRHPRSSEMALDLPEQGVIEIPQRLPLEILAPLLQGTEVVGMLSSALIYLRCLGADVRVSTMVPASYTNSPILNIYRAVGVQLLD